MAVCERLTVSAASRTEKPAAAWKRAVERDIGAQDVMAGFSVKLNFDNIVP
jgi:hypothetical protein